MPRTRFVTGCIAVVALAACTGQRAEGNAARTSGATIVHGHELTGSAILLDALVQRVQTLNVSRPGSGCPVIIIRGQAVGRTTGSATVYVDGTRMRDTCVLQQIQSAAIDRVELYPVAARPSGYTAGPGGVLLVYTRR